MDANSAAVLQAYAAGVQAVGSIAAIGAAIWIASNQARADRRLRVEETRDRLESLWTMIDNCRSRVAAVREYALMAPMVAAAKKLDDNLVLSMRASLEIVSALPPEMAPTAKSAEALIGARIAITNAVGIVPQPQVEFLVKYERDLDTLRDALKAAADELRSDVDKHRR